MATAPIAKSAPRLSGVRVYVIPLNMDKVIFDRSRLDVLQLNGTWMGPQEKVLATDPRKAPTIPPLDQESTTHIVTELMSRQAVKTYLGVEAINAAPSAAGPATSSAPAATTTRMNQERFAKVQSTEDGQPLQFHEIVRGINEDNRYHRTQPFQATEGDADDVLEQNQGPGQEPEQEKQPLQILYFCSPLYF
ncbi:hypothetical protein BGZ70_000705 [Mortierella alpina]|uniref:Uncharacterized protein n=1 Tax=Mortierella alpina TaxID=64518 RepID=A0A9P6IXD3_MORAP|nr:hypothetical protein BGZ70_000705 [Mortierella alpina]